MKKIDVLPLDLFSAGVPAGLIYMFDSEELRELVSKSAEDEGQRNTIAELSFIGIIAYFEAFCKNHFASILNICPELIRQLKKTGKDIKIDATSLLNIKENSQYKLGFLLSERYDFGTSHKINSYYQSILKVNPFSKDEEKRHNRILRDRNLLVHHGGIFTTRYSSEQSFINKSFGEKAHFASLIIGKKEFFATADFLEKIVRKTTTATKKKIFHFVESETTKLTDSQKKALELVDLCKLS